MDYDETEKLTLINNIWKSAYRAGDYLSVIYSEWERRLENVIDRCKDGDYKELTSDILWLNQMIQEVYYQMMTTQKDYGKLLALIEYPKNNKSEDKTSQ